MFYGLPYILLYKKFKGVLGGLYRKDEDISINNYRVVPDRYEHVHFLFRISEFM